MVVDWYLQRRNVGSWAWKTLWYWSLYCDWIYQSISWDPYEYENGWIVDLRKFKNEETADWWWSDQCVELG